MNEPIFYTTKDIQDILKIGRDKAYTLMRSASFPSIKIGGQYLVSKDSFLAWIQRYEYKSVAL